MEMRYAMRPHDWASLAAIIAAVFFVSSVFLGQLLLASITGLIVVSSVIATRSWSSKYPGPMPYAMRWVLFLVPHAPRYLKRMLQPVAGERVLEIGPGLGHHALAIAPLLHPDGALHVLDLQQPMLNAIMRRTVAAGMTNVVPTRADAQNLPFGDATFDAAYLSTVLGEIPNQRRALDELRRVLKPHGRLVIAEVLLDPDYVPLSQLRDNAESLGFVFDGKLGPGFAYLVRFRASQS